MPRQAQHDGRAEGHVDYVDQAVGLRCQVLVHLLADDVAASLHDEAGSMGKLLQLLKQEVGPLGEPALGEVHRFGADKLAELAAEGEDVLNHTTMPAGRPRFLATGAAAATAMASFLSLPRFQLMSA